MRTIRQEYTNILLTRTSCRIYYCDTPNRGAKPLDTISISATSWDRWNAREQQSVPITAFVRIRIRREASYVSRRSTDACARGWESSEGNAVGRAQTTVMDECTILGYCRRPTNLLQTRCGVIAQGNRVAAGITLENSRHTQPGLSTALCIAPTRHRPNAKSMVDRIIL